MTGFLRASRRESGREIAEHEHGAEVAGALVELARVACPAGVTVVGGEACDLINVATGDPVCPGLSRPAAEAIARLIEGGEIDDGDE